MEGAELPVQPAKVKFLPWVLALMVMSLAGISFWVYSPDKPRELLQAEYAGDYRSIGNLRLRLRDTGPRDAPAIILIHGFSSSLDTWEPWAQALSKRYRVIRFDLPGFGLTGADPSGNYSDERAVQILTSLMDQRRVDRAHVIGNSLGGRIAWTFAAMHPDRVSHLVLISPDGFASPGFEYGKAPDMPFVMQALPYATPRSMLKANLAAAYAKPEKLSEASLTRYHDMILAPGVRRAILARLEQTVLLDPAPRLATIAAPTLLLWGEQDGMIPISNAADYIKHIPNAKVVRLPDLGHVPFEEDPARSLPPVEQFLDTSSQ